MAAAAASSTKKRKKIVPCSDGTVTFEKTQTSYSLPNDIIIEILSLVPTKALLLRLRWTCKYWFDLITKDPDFLKMHLHRSTSTNFHSPSILISNPPIEVKPLYTKSRMFFQCSIDSTTGSFSPRIRTSFPSKNICDDDFRILGSCHGLLFFSSYSTNAMNYFIWNPCTKEYRKLPDPDEDDGPFRKLLTFGLLTFGFGYDSSIDDYKVIIFQYFFTQKAVRVYTLRTNSWSSSSSILPLTSLCHDFSNGVFVNGALYFIYHHSDQYYSNTKILSFDIEKETFKEISIQPEWCLHDDGLKAVTLEVFEGSLCLVVSTTYNVDMWMMKKDYTVNNDKESSWTKLVKFRRPAFRGGYRNNLNPLRLKNGEITVFDRPEFYRLHWAEQVIAVYIDSLVSLNSGTYYTVDEHEQLN